MTSRFSHAPFLNIFAMSDLFFNASCKITFM